MGGHREKKFNNNRSRSLGAIALPTGRKIPYLQMFDSCKLLLLLGARATVLLLGSLGKEEQRKKKEKIGQCSHFLWELDVHFLTPLGRNKVLFLKLPLSVSQYLILVKWTQARGFWRENKANFTNSSMVVWILVSYSKFACYVLLFRDLEYLLHAFRPSFRPVLRETGWSILIPTYPEPEPEDCYGN